MKLFQQLLIAPAALGLLAPLAASADQLNTQDVDSGIATVEPGAFSTTTKLNGKAIFTVGGTDEAEVSDSDAITFNYTWQANLNTSFTGRDLLYTRLKTGNFGPSNLKNSSGVYLNHANSNDDSVKVDKLWYQFPVGDNFKVWFGAKIENYYMLASSPSIYNPILKELKLGGNGAVYGASTGQGFGAAWTQSVEDSSEPRFALSANYTASSSSGETADPEQGGILTDGAKGMFLTKLEYGSPRWQISAAYSHKTADPNASAGFGTAAGKSRTGETDAVGIRGYWRPETTGIIPSVSVGWDTASVDDDGTSGATEETNSWMVGLSWKDAFVDGNSAGVAISQRQYASERVGTGDDPADENFIWEAYYTFKVSDNISVTPAVFGLNDPKDGNDDDVVGAVVNTTFRF